MSNFVLNSITALLLCGLFGRGTSQPCLYNYTISTGSTVIVTQSAPVCLICSNTAYTSWTIGGSPTFPIVATPYILYVPTPTSTFSTGPNVRCSTSNGASSASSFVNIAAPVVPQLVTYVNESDTLSLACSNVITASISVVDNQKWLDPFGNLISYFTTASVPYINRTDAGNYTCATQVVPNANGLSVINGSTTVVVYYPPTIVSQQSSIYVLGGLNIQLNCTYENGFPLPTTVTWTSPNGSVVVSQGRFLVQSTNTSTSLTISSLVGGGDNGTYACKASNSRGVSSSYAVQLFVQVPPDPPSNLSVTHANSSTISLIWTNGFNGYSPLMSVVISYEVITYPPQGTSTQNFTSLTSATLIGLHSTSNYSIHIQLVNAVGLISNPSSINYYMAVPTTPPTSSTSSIFGSTQLWIYYTCLALAAAWAIKPTMTA